MINRSMPYINKKNHSPPFPFPFFLLFHFVPHCLIFHFFPRHHFPPPLAIVFCTINTHNTQYMNDFVKQSREQIVKFPRLSLVPPSGEFLLVKNGSMRWVTLDTMEVKVQLLSCLRLVECLDPRVDIAHLNHYRMIVGKM